MFPIMPVVPAAHIDLHNVIRRARYQRAEMYRRLGITVSVPRTAKGE